MKRFSHKFIPLRQDKSYVLNIHGKAVLVDNMVAIGLCKQSVIMSVYFLNSMGWDGNLN